jgi:hypothetical protein
VSCNGESLDTLKPSFEAWSKSTVGAEKIDVVVAIEEKKKISKKPILRN